MSTNPFEPAPQSDAAGRPGDLFRPSQPAPPGFADEAGQPAEPSPFTQTGAPVPADGEPVPAARSGRGRTVALVGGILAIVAVGAGGAFAFQQVNGGGAQPESVLPANTIAFAKVDLDPSAGQKLDAIRFIRKFPDAQGEVKEDSDLRQVIFQGIQRDGQLKGVDYAKDVAPWLGQRIGVGLVPGATEDVQPTVVVALAVSDQDKAKVSLPKVAEAAHAQCQVVEEFALCTDGAGKLAPVTAAVGKGTLADSATFSKDMADLGEDGIVSAWFDAQKVSTAAKSLHVGDLIPGFSGGPVTSQTGRMALALRFDGPHLELAGHSSGASVNFTGSRKGTGLADLPDTTLAAVSVTNAGDQLRAGWPALEKAVKETAGEQEFTDGVAAVEQELGISVPDDLYAALGSRFALVFGGMGEGQSDLRLAAVTDGDPAVLQKLADAASKGTSGDPLQLTPGKGGTVLSLSDGYADELTTSSGLGATDRFKDAVKGDDSARVAGFVDISGLVTEFKDELGADEAKNLAGLSALGFTISGEGNSADFSLRLTTK